MLWFVRGNKTLWMFKFLTKVKFCECRTETILFLQGYITLTVKCTPQNYVRAHETVNDNSQRYYTSNNYV